MTTNPYESSAGASDPGDSAVDTDAAAALEPRVRPRVWPIPIVVMLAFCIHTLSSIAAFFGALWAIHGSLNRGMFRDEGLLATVAQSPLGISITLILPQALMIVPVLVAAKLSPLSMPIRLGLVRGTWPLKLWISSAIATPIVGLISSLIVGGLMGESESLEEMTSIFRSLGQGGFFIPLALMVGITPGICEELLFRGYVQTRLVQRWGGILAILITSAVFAAFHMDLIHSTAVMAVGIYLGWLSWASGSIFPAMIAHFVNNFLSVVAVVVLPQSAIGSGPMKPEDLPDGAVLIMSGTVLCSLVALVYTLRQAHSHRRQMREAGLLLANESETTGTDLAELATSSNQRHQSNDTIYRDSRINVDSRNTVP